MLMKQCKRDYIDYIKNCDIYRKPSANSVNQSGRKCIIIELQHLVVDFICIDTLIILGFLHSPQSHCSLDKMRLHMKIHQANRA